MKKTLITICLLMNIFYQKSLAQNESKSYFDRITLGTSFTVIPDKPMNPNTGENYLYMEYTLNNNLAIDITRRWRLGLQYLKTYTKSQVFGSQDFYRAGTFLQFNFFPKDAHRDRLYIELSYNLGNLCTCGELEPYKKDNLHYYGYGLGGDFKLTNWMRLDLGFFNYEIFHKTKEQYNWTQYVIGLEFPISIKSKK